MVRRILAALMLLVVALTGCASGRLSGQGAPGAAGGPVEGGRLVLSMFAAPKGVFNPILQEDAYDAKVVGLLYSGLLRLGEQLEWVCDLCESYTLSPDQRTVTFKLRSGLTWHDGQPVTTRDVAFTFRTVLHPDYTGVRTSDYAALAGVEAMLDGRDRLQRQVAAKELSQADAARQRQALWEGWLQGDGRRAIAVIDERTIAFTTDEPYAPFLQALALGIIPAHIFEPHPVSAMAQHPAVRKPVGTGPYRFVAHATDQFIHLTRFDNFHLGKPRIPTLIYKIAHQDVAIGQLKSGEIDYMETTPSDVALLQGDPHIALFTRPDLGYQYLGINHDHPVLADKRVRQAMMYAINRQAIVDGRLKGYGTVMNSHMVPALWAYDEKALNPYPHDPAKAAALLAEAGWSQKNRDGYRVRDGKVLALTLKYPPGNKVREATAPLIQADLKAVGIKVTLKMEEFASLATAVFDSRDMELWLMGWGLSVDPDPGPLFLPNNKWGRVTGWSNGRSEELIRLGTRTLKAAERKPIYVEWARILNEELPYIFLYSQHVIDAVRVDRVRGLKPDARGTLWNIWEWWIPADRQ